jgi:hypothetical protein
MAGGWDDREMRLKAEREAPSWRSWASYWRRQRARARSAGVLGEQRRGLPSAGRCRVRAASWRARPVGKRGTGACGNAGGAWAGRRAGGEAAGTSDPR